MKKATAASVEVQWLSKSSLNYFYIARFYIQRLADDIKLNMLYHELYFLKFSACSNISLKTSSFVTGG